MERYEVFLFGSFQLKCHGVTWSRGLHHKAWQLFCYLASHRHLSHTRDSLAGLFWGDLPNEQAKKLLRQTLWRLHTEAPSAAQSEPTRLVVVEDTHVGLNPAIEWWIDAEVFEKLSKGLRQAAAMNTDVKGEVRRVVELYRGDFLEGCYQDWCLYERERLQNQYLDLLDKLIDHCLSQGEYEDGLLYGAQVLQLNPGAERAHRQLMKLHYLAGDRTAALHQFQCCRKALREELGVEPGAASQALFAQICADQPGLSLAAAAAPAYAVPKSLGEVLSHLRQFQSTLATIQQQIQQDIHLVEKFMPDQQDG